MSYATDDDIPESVMKECQKQIAEWRKAKMPPKKIEQAIEGFYQGKLREHRENADSFYPENATDAEKAAIEMNRAHLGLKPLQNRAEDKQYGQAYSDKELAGIEVTRASRGLPALTADEIAKLNHDRIMGVQTRGPEEPDVAPPEWSRERLESERLARASRGDRDIVANEKTPSRQWVTTKKA